jgi:hypothetical protein
MSLFEQSFGEMTPDESRTASQKYVHSASSKQLLVNLGSVPFGMIAYQIACPGAQRPTGLVGGFLTGASA